MLLWLLLLWTFPIFPLSECFCQGQTFWVTEFKLVSQFFGEQQQLNLLQSMQGR